MRSIAGGKQPFYVPIAPKPPATLTQYPLATSSTTSTGLTQAFVASALDLSNLPILVQTQSTPTVQNCTDMVAQTTLLPSTGASSGLPVTAQDPLSASSIVTLTETTSSLRSSGNMVPQSQSPLSAVITQNQSTTAVHSSTSILPQTQSVSQTPLTPAINNIGYTVARDQPSLSGTVSQISSAPSIPRSGNTLGQNQLQSSAVVLQSSSSPADPTIDDMVPQRPLQTPPPIIIVSHNASSQPVQSSLNMPPQNQLPMLSISHSDFTQPFRSGGMSTNNQSSSTIVSHTGPSQVPESAAQRSVSTYGISDNTSMPLYQNSACMVRQDQSQSFASWSTAHHQRRFSSTPGVPGISLEQSLFGTPSPLTSFDPARLTAGGNNPTTNEVRNESHESYFGLSTSNRSVESPLNVLANASDIVQREQTTNSNAGSLHVQV